jgi:hypothetical protein
VGHEHAFVIRVEPYDGPYRPARGKEGSEPAVCEDALDEVLAQSARGAGGPTTSRGERPVWTACPCW